MIGNVSSPSRSIVDRRGLLTPGPAGWSLDWWIGAEDRWHFPSQEDSVRQSLLGRAPIVETAMRVPGGDAVERVYTVADGGGFLVVEIENRSAVPFEVALALRPGNPTGPAPIECIDRRDGRVVTIDGRPALVLGRRPSAFATTTAGGDLAALVVAHATTESLDPVRCGEGMAQAAVIYPLAHRATLRVVVPLEPGHRPRDEAVRPPVVTAAGLADSLASAPTVARAWNVQAARGMRLELPAGLLADAIEANRKYLLVFHGGRELTAGPCVPPGLPIGATAALLSALDRYGFHDEAGEVLRAYAARQSRAGSFADDRQGHRANGVVIHAIAEHWRLARDRDLLADLHGPVWRGAKRIQRRRRSDGDAWSVVGLRDAAEILGVVGDERRAAWCRRWADVLLADWTGTPAPASAPAPATAPAGTSAAGAHQAEIDPRIFSALIACEPLGLVGPHDPAMIASVDAIRDWLPPGEELVRSPADGTPAASRTLRLAAVELAGGDPVAMRRLQSLVGAASATFTWPEANRASVDGEGGRGAGLVGTGQDGRAVGEFLGLVRSMLVREVAVGIAGTGQSPIGLDLCSMLPEAWRGQPLEVQEAPTAVGRLSFALRWHGRRPAILWDLATHPGSGRVRIGAPTLDPSWTSEERHGEALLAEQPLGPPGSSGVSGATGALEPSGGER